MEVEVLGVAIDLQKDQERVLLPMVDTNKCMNRRRKKNQ